MFRYAFGSAKLCLYNGIAERISMGIQKPLCSKDGNNMQKTPSVTTDNVYYMYYNFAFIMFWLKQAISR
jgi:hypothetical protein